jgi:hypothetical protein
MRPCRRESERACTGAASRSRVAFHRPRPTEPAPPCAGAGIGPNRRGPSKETPIYRVVSGAAPAVLRAGGTWSRGRRNSEQGPHLWGCDSGAGQGASLAGPRASAGSHPRGNPVPPSDAPACGNATVEPDTGVSLPALRVSPRCGHSRRAQAWGGVAAQRPGQTSPNAALCAPARTTLRETESGAHPQRGPSSALRHTLLRYLPSRRLAVTRT